MNERQYHQLLSAGRSLVETFDLEDVLARLLDVARDVTTARYAAIGVLDDRRELLARFLVSGIDDDAHRRIGNLPRGHGVLGELIRNPGPLRLRSVGDHPRSYGFPPGHPPMETFLGVPILIGGEPFGNLYLTEKAGGDFDDDDQQAVALIADWAAVAIGNAQLHHAVTEQRDELRQAVETLEATTSIARALAGETDLDRVLELIAKRGRAVVDARLLVITLVTPAGVEVAAGAGEQADEILSHTFRYEGSNTERVLRSGSTLRFDSQDVEHLARRTAEAAGIRATCGLLVPLIFRHQPIGVLAAFDRLHGDAFTDDHQRVLEAFAVSAATAVGTAQSVTLEQRRRALEATEAERRRWARELHDETLQEMAAVRLGLSMGLRGETVEELRDTIRRAVGDLDGGIGGLRGLISDLRPAALDQLGAQSALEGLVERVRTRGIDVTLSVDLDYEGGRVPTRHLPELEDALYRLTQEALTNVLKHARATRADVTVRERDEHIELIVADDGRGLPQNGSRNGGGFGLVGMRERAELLGGSLDLTSRPGAGTTLHVVLPVRRRRAS